jgi:hypothetical protein
MGLHGHGFEERSWNFERSGDLVIPHTSAYISLNPVKAALVSDPALYPYSGYSALIGKRDPYPWHRPDKVLHCLSKDSGTARLEYQAYVEGYREWLADVKAASRRWVASHRPDSSRAANLVSEIEFAGFVDAGIRRVAGAFPPPDGLDNMDLRLFGVRWYTGSSIECVATVSEWSRQGVKKRLDKIGKLFRGCAGAEDAAKGYIRQALLWVPHGKVDKSDEQNMTTIKEAGVAVEKN